MNNSSSSPEINISKTKKQKGAASCRACGTHITFKKLETGRSIPLEDDSNVHRCVQWRNWRADDDTR
jgi:hypothetical protein